MPRLPSIPMRLASSRLAARRLGGARSLSAFLPGVPRQLDDVVKRDQLVDETPARISSIWQMHHEDQAGVAGAAISAEEHDLIIERGNESPLFVFPLHRDGGHFMLLSQFAPKERMFVMTFLDDYKRNPALAPPWLSVLLFDELLPSKAVALMRAEADADRIRKAETSRLLSLVRLYYGTSAYGERATGVYTFNHADHHFKLDEFLKACPRELPG